MPGCPLDTIMVGGAMLIKVVVVTGGGIDCNDCIVCRGGGGCMVAVK